VAGYTFAASAYIVVCTPLTSPPVHPRSRNIASVGAGVICGTASAPAIAPTHIAIIVTRDPTRVITAAPMRAPTTPPRFHAARPFDDDATSSDRPSAPTRGKAAASMLGHQNTTRTADNS